MSRHQSPAARNSVDQVGEEDADRDRELVERHEPAAQRVGAISAA